MSEVDCAIGRAVRERLAAEQHLITLLRAGEGLLTKAELKRLGDLEALARIGLEAIRKKRPKGWQQVEALSAAFLEYGPHAVFNAGAQRGGDFLLNQLQGRWAESVVLSMPITGLVLQPFGPTGAAMPGEEDYRATRHTFDMISRLERKRPDIIGFQSEDWDALSTSEREAILSWPTRTLSTSDIALLQKAAVGIEVKNSSWHYGQRRSAGGDALSITVKEEELTILKSWSERYGVPVVFVQVLFDEAYVMSFKRMQEVIASQPNKKKGPYQDGDYYRDKQTGEKEYHHIYTGLADQQYRCADVSYPDESEGVVHTLHSGNVIPYIKYAPARALNVHSEVVRREIEY